jgi:1,4-dihydroxy-2-naphthoyl-CoA synthase
MMSPAYETILYEVDDRIATITFNRPEKLNAVNPLMGSELRDAFGRAEGDDDVWTIIVTGAGRAFCAGAAVETVRTDGRAYEGKYLSKFANGRHHGGDPPFEHGQAHPGCCQRTVLRRRRDLVTTGDIVIIERASSSTRTSASA